MEGTSCKQHFFQDFILKKWEYLLISNKVHCNIEVLMYKKKFFRCKKKTKWLRYSCLKLALRVCAGQCSSPCYCLISTNEIFFIKIKYFVHHKPKFCKKNEKLRTF